MVKVLEKEIAIVQRPPGPLTVDDFDDYYACIELEGGYRKLSLNFELGSCRNYDGVTTYLEDVESVDETLRIPGLTTALYERAKIVMQRVADLRRREVAYMLTTKNHKLAAWAQDIRKGAGVFNWDKTDFTDGQFSLFKAFYPNDTQ